MRTSVRYVFKGRPPVAFVAVFILLAINFCLGDGLTSWAWVPAPDALHSYGIRFRGGGWRYYSPAVGWYVDQIFFGLQFALMAVAGFVFWLYRDRLVKVEAPPPATGPAGRWDWLAMVIAAPAACSLVGGAVISILLREAGWTAALVAALLFLAISLTIVVLALRPQFRRSPPPGWPTILGLAGAISLATLAAVAELFDRLG
ncbi:MAG TPA: hypothetical protein VGG20_07510 [Thermoanaerobaculia bacterium]|jgi:hypothetical protein